MQNNNPNNHIQGVEIDLNWFLKLLINSHKLIIAITLVITILVSINASQEKPLYISSAILEIGKYSQDQNKEILIEPSSSLIEELKINFIHKQQANVIFDSEKDRIVKFTTKSTNPEKNIDLLNEMIGYSINRHSNLVSNFIQKTNKKLTYEIESLNNQIEFKNKILFTQNEDKKIRITNQIEKINNKLPQIDSKIKEIKKVILEDNKNFKLLAADPDVFLERAAQSPTLTQIIHSYNNQLLNSEAEKINLSQEKDSLETQLKRLESNNLESEMVFKLSQEKDNLELELEFLIKQNPTSTQSIREIKTKEVRPNKKATILLGFIIGLFISISIAFIKYSSKTFKEE